MNSLLKRRYLIGIVSIAGILSGCVNEKNTAQSGSVPASYDKSRDLKHFNDYVSFLKQKAIDQGVSAEIIRRTHHIHYIPKAVELDKAQAAKKPKSNATPLPPNPHGVSNYLNKVLTQAKVDAAISYWWQYQPQLQKASRKYGVQQAYIMALWGMESSFGQYQGNFDVLSVLATLAFDGRREALFSQEFINALKMLDNGLIARNEMKGSWAGAMGQTQFMPTSYLNYAADGDDDGKKDIWQNQYDAFASIANYLATVGWDKNLPWGIEVKLAQPVDLAFSGIEADKAKSLSEWQALGIYSAYPTAYENQKLAQLNKTQLWLVRPDKEVGRAFLVSNNYRTIMDWNKSHNFAISIGKFADKIQQGVQ